MDELSPKMEGTIKNVDPFEEFGIACCVYPWLYLSQTFSLYVNVYTVYIIYINILYTHIFINDGQLYIYILIDM